MEYLDLIVDLHIHNSRQGPGSDAVTAKALSLLPNYRQFRNILDVGCGTGGQTLVLAKNTNAQITAVDFIPAFLGKMMRRVKAAGLEGRVSPLCLSMDRLDFAANSFDVIWSEGAIYNIGFRKGLLHLKRFLREGGYLAVSEISWTTESRPKEIEEYWTEEYREIGTVDEKLSIIKRCGLTPVNHFVLPKEAWDSYYTHVKSALPAFLERHPGDEAAAALASETAKEIEMYEKYGDYYSYGFYMMKIS